MKQVDFFAYKLKLSAFGNCFFFFRTTSLVFLTFVLQAAVCNASESKSYSIRPELRADVNRDGLIDFKHKTEKRDNKKDKSPWDLRGGALVLANLDDDASRCTESVAIDGLSVTACNDSKDTIINGEDDILDLAPLSLLPWPDAPDKARAVIAISSKAKNKARLFIQQNGQWQWLPANKPLTAQQLREGVNMRLEALDIVRDHQVWDGRIDVIATVADGKTKGVDSVQFHVAPLILETDLMKMARLYLPGMPWGQDDPGSIAIGPGLKPNASQAIKTFPGYLNILDAAKPGLSASSQATLTLQKLGLLGSAYKAFFDDFVGAVKKAGSNAKIIGLPTFEDPWVQDMFEMAYSSLPINKGKAQVMHVAIRSAQPQRISAQKPLTQLIGPNVGIVEQWKDDSGLSTESGDYSLNSTGNVGTVPPYIFKNKKYPLGRIIYGAGKTWVQTGGGIFDSSIVGDDLVFAERKPDQSFIKMLNAQGVQKPIVIDTAWLAVGHVDEIVAFVPADTKRGWKVVVADPLVAWNVLTRMADQGYGNSKFLSKLEPWASGLVPEELDKTVNDIINDPVLADAQKTTDAKIANTIEILKIETGIENSDIIRVPVIFEPTFFNPYNFTAKTPNAANLVVINNKTVAIAKQHGPLFKNVDVFESLIAKSFADAGLTVHWVEDYVQAHGGNGEIHCQSNFLRDPGKLTLWWQPKQSH